MLLQCFFLVLRRKFKWLSYIAHFFCTTKASFSTLFQLPKNEAIEDSLVTPIIVLHYESVFFNSVPKNEAVEDTLVIPVEPFIAFWENS